MTQEQITEGNELIAKFMGLKGFENTRYGMSWTNIVTNERHESLEYHESWDWLMPVVRKVFDTLVGNVEDWTFLIEKRIRDSVLLIDIEQTWLYVVEFAKKHNEKNGL